MKKIALLSHRFFPTFPFAEIKLLKQLRKKADVDFYMFKDDPRFLMPLCKDFYGKLGVKKINNPKAIKTNANYVFACGFDYKYNGSVAARVAKKNGASIFMYDVGGIDCTVRTAPTHYFSTKGPWTTKNVMRTVGRDYKGIFTDGCIYFDDVAEPLDKSAFFEKYNLDKNKKLALMVPASPVEVGIQGKSITGEYTHILKELNRCSGWQTLIKGHPCDYHPLYSESKALWANRNFHYNGKSSWEKFAKGAPINVCEPQDGYDAIKASDAIVGITSSLMLEIPMFYKPVICVNRHKYKINWQFDKRIMRDVLLKELRSTLNNDLSIDRKVCKHYIKAHTVSNDGKSYMRVARSILKIAGGDK